MSTDQTKDDVLDALSKIVEVKEAHRVYGTYDVVILVEAEDTRKLKDVTINAVRKLGFVHSTMTLLSLTSFDKSEE